MKRQNEILVGILTTVAVAILILGTYWLARGSFAGGYDLYTVTNWGQGLKTGQRVLFAGVSVGYVEDVELRMEGKLIINMVIEDKYKIPLGSTATIQPIGLFGDMIVALTPLGPGTAFHAPGDTLPVGKPAASPSDVIAAADSVMKTLQAIMTGIHRELIDAGTVAQVRTTVASTDQLITQLSSIAATQSAQLTTTMASLQRAVSAVDSAQVGATLRNFQTASADVVELTAGLDSIRTRLAGLVTRLETGQGTAGKLLNDPALYNDLTTAVGNVNALLLDFKANPKKYLGFNFSIFGGRQ